MKKNIKKSYSQTSNFCILMGLEIKSQLTPIKLLFAILLAFLPLFSVAVNTGHDYSTIRGTHSPLGQLVTQALINALIIRIFSITIDKFSFDKNQAQFLVYPKNMVIFTKYLVDIMLFLITIVFSVLGGILIILFWKNGNIASAVFENITLFIVAIGLFYFVISLVIRAILAMKSINNKEVLQWQKNIMILLTIIFTFITYIVFSFLILNIDNEKMNLNQTKYYEYPFRDFIKNNVEWIAFIPIFNFSIIAMILYGFLDWYWIFPNIFYFILITLIIFKPLARNYKEYLTT